MPPKTTETTPEVTAKRVERSRSSSNSKDDARTTDSDGSPPRAPHAAAAPPKSYELANVAFLTSLAVLPLGAATAVRLLAVPTWHSRRSTGSRPLLVGASIALGLGLVRWQLGRWFTEEPAYELVDTVDDLEIRDYPPMVVAEATLESADWDTALDNGFRVLADYIFGKNASQEKVAMTAPVQASNRESTHERLATQGPVATSDNDEGVHTTTFVMPAGRSLRSLPLPLDERIRLRHVSSRRIAVLRFAGSYSEAPVRDKMRELVTKAKRGGLVTRGKPNFAGYDPPTTLPFLRRNEVWVEVGTE